jgi:glutathione S-transferase
LISQTPNILLFLGGKLGLAPRDESGKLWTHQLQLTIADFASEIHDTHHPLSSALYYEEQKSEAKRRTEHFLEARLPKFFDYFEKVLKRNPARGDWLVGSRLTYVDLSMAQVVAGLGYAFPNRFGVAIGGYPRLASLRERVFARARIKAYVGSGRRIEFNQHGLFRHYPELDQ